MLMRTEATLAACPGTKPFLITLWSFNLPSIKDLSKIMRRLLKVELSLRSRTSYLCWGWSFLHAIMNSEGFRSRLVCHGVLKELSQYLPDLYFWRSNSKCPILLNEINLPSVIRKQWSSVKDWHVTAEWRDLQDCFPPHEHSYKQSD